MPSHILIDCSMPQRPIVSFSHRSAFLAPRSWSELSEFSRKHAAVVVNAVPFWNGNLVAFANALLERESEFTGSGIRVAIFGLGSREHNEGILPGFSEAFKTEYVPPLLLLLRKGASIGKHTGPIETSDVLDWATRTLGACDRELRLGGDQEGRSD